MRTPIGVLSCVLLLGLTACGSKTDSAVEAYKQTAPKTIVTDAHAALDKLTSVHVRGTVYFGAEQGYVDLTSDKAGNVTGTITLVGATANYRYVNKHSYLQAGDDFWSKTVSAEAVPRLSGKWVQDLKPLSDLLVGLTLPGMVTSAKTHPLEDADPTLIGTGDVDGAGTVQIKVSDTLTGTQKTLQVSASAPHNVVQLTDTLLSDPKVTGTLTFDRFNTPVTVTAPPANEVTTAAQAAAQK